MQKEICYAYILLALVDRNRQKKITFAHLYTVRLNKLKIQVYDVLNFSLLEKKSSVVVIKVKGFFHEEKNLKIKSKLLRNQG